MKKKAGRPPIGKPIPVHFFPEQAQWLFEQARKTDPPQPVAAVIRNLVAQAMTGDELFVYKKKRGPFRAPGESY